ncbi:MAG: DUF4143 domain-containing protein [Bacteroidales bacterium]|nr:DUF4143 domain-containing protein [Bacteroidales bacterium]
MEKEYRKRVVDSLLELELESMGAVLIEGPKWCGKTTTAEQHAQSILYMDDPSTIDQNLEMASINPKRLLSGAKPRLIDEWQMAPQLWDAIRFLVDHQRGEGQYILTGSAVPADRSKIRHSGAGRFSWLTMRPMSLWESGESTGQVSLSNLFSGETPVDGESHLKIEDIAFLICRGGWPETLTKKPEAARTVVRNYLKAVVNSDISRVDGVNRSADRAMRIIRSLARGQGAQIPITSIRKDIISNETDAMDESTIYSYIDALKKIFVVEDAPAWNPNLRSKTAIRTSDTRYFVDPSVAVSALGATPQDLINDLETMGLLFETMAIRDLRVYAQALGGDVYHYRDSNGLECDAVVHLANGSYGLVEVKLGGEKRIAEGVKTLNSLANIIDTTRMKAPAFKMIVVAVGDYAYRRQDGVAIVPIGALKD